MTLVKIIGGHGRVAQIIAQQLVKAEGIQVESYIRKPEQASTIEKLGSKPVVFDVTKATPAELTNEFKSADIVVWAAGAGETDNPKLAYDIDRDGAIAVVDALKLNTNLKRLIVISAMGMDYTPVLEESYFLYHYYHAKSVADRYVAESGLPYTILGPGWLSDKPGSGKVQVEISREEADVRQPNPKQVSRTNVATVVTTIITNEKCFKAQLNKSTEILDGDVPIVDALTK